MIGSTAKQELEELIIPVDFFMGMSATQARAGIRQISRINQNLQHRKKIAGLYDELLGQHGWEITKVPEHTEPILVRYPVRITDKNGAIIAAAKHGIELGTWFISPLHNVTKKLEMYDYIWGMCPVAEKATREVVNLPLHLRTSERTAHRTFEFICKFQQTT
jgi:dTDP-4-amino-4,6-dideoxygalactose transaminase